MVLHLHDIRAQSGEVRHARHVVSQHLDQSCENPNCAKPASIQSHVRLGAAACCLLCAVTVGTGCCSNSGEVCTPRAGARWSHAEVDKMLDLVWHVHLHMSEVKKSTNACVRACVLNET